VDRYLVSYAMLPMLGFAAIIQTTVGPRLAIARVQPDLVLLVLLVWTLLFGSREGIVWAFVGGLWLDLLSGGPMGASSLALMVAVLLAGMGHARLFRSNLMVPSLATLLGTLAYSLTYLLILAEIRVLIHGYSLEMALDRLLMPSLERLVLPAMLYNSALMLLLTPFLNRVPEQRDVGRAHV
jgi:rod shape-determining protein MreD